MMDPEMMTTTPEFIYDAIRKVAVAGGTSSDGRTWKIEFHKRNPDDSLAIVVLDPAGGGRSFTVTEDDFAFTDDTVALRCLPNVTLRMQPIYVKKLRGFTRGNIPTPDIPGPTLP